MQRIVSLLLLKVWQLRLITFGRQAAGRQHYRLDFLYSLEEVYRLVRQKATEVHADQNWHASHGNLLLHSPLELCAQLLRHDISAQILKLTITVDEVRHCVRQHLVDGQKFVVARVLVHRSTDGSGHALATAQVNNEYVSERYSTFTASNSQFTTGICHGMEHAHALTDLLPDAHVLDVMVLDPAEDPVCLLVREQLVHILARYIFFLLVPLRAPLREVAIRLNTTFNVHLV
mmetsp:Transcript_30604/g.68536  ORF Transcript_30604/g.68536 Transcript_30604/m.68536 type:complete len:232 (+) Transcript_30604:1581-2276(+)